MRMAAIVLGLSLAASLACADAALAADAKSAAAKPPAKAAALPRTPDGHPDLQGVVWSEPYMAMLSLFPTAPTELVLPEDKAKAAFERLARLVTSNPAIAIDPEAVSIFKDSKGFPLVRGERHTRLLVNPADGRLPYTPAGLRESGKLMLLPSKADNPEERLVGERCLTLGALPPMAFTSPLNPLEFIQSPGYVAVHTEYGDEVRVIPFGDRHGPPALGLAMGDSIARWEGDTLVIETTNLPEWGRLRLFPIALIVSPESKVTEKFTRLSADELLYQFTVEDPKVYAAPWLGEYSMYRADFRMFPSTCHEGNYGLPNILAGAREEEKRAAAK